MLSLSEFELSFWLQYYFILNIIDSRYCTVKGRDHLIVHSSVVLKRGDEDDLAVGWVPVPFTLLGQMR